MFDTISSGFKNATLKLKGQTQLTRDNIEPALELVKNSLLDADVDYSVVKDFLAKVSEKSLGEVITYKSKSGQKISASDYFTKICHDELIELLKQDNEFDPQSKELNIIMLVGLQGAGKTTHAAKLAKLFSSQFQKNPLLVAADVYRPAARDQLKILGEKIQTPVFTLDTQDAVEIAKAGVQFAKEHRHDVVIIDTAGRLAIDEPLMDELENIKNSIQPKSTFIVIDAMIGQDAVKTAKAFDNRLNLSGVILTKMDGDTRGGSALSIKKVTGKGIVFVGTGEQLDNLDVFRAEGMASRILGLGDIVGLVEDFEKAIDKETIENFEQRMNQGIFDFSDYQHLILSIGKMGPLKNTLEKMPFMSQLPSGALGNLPEKILIKHNAIVNSMTKSERANPNFFLNNSPSARSRMARIARGSANSEKEVKDFVDGFFKLKDVMTLFSGFNPNSFMDKVPGLAQLNKIANIAKVAKMMNKGGMPGMPGMPGFDMGANPLGQNPISSSDLARINRLKKLKREEKKSKRR